eukprot:TRINITY_DN52803_c0_g1_i1.p1 TRINITY_DN52803_c0_g1~~TRINITY_DN52803_c0_g1_i1.p1  ORF type:complete len:624 (+),score=98.10 TRINITY_DN52803_c0_g1_i1:48-1919(+)
MEDHVSTLELLPWGGSSLSALILVVISTHLWHDGKEILKWCIWMPSMFYRGVKNMGWQSTDTDELRELKLREMRDEVRIYNAQCCMDLILSAEIPGILGALLYCTAANGWKPAINAVLLLHIGIYLGLLCIKYGARLTGMWVDVIAAGLYSVWIVRTFLMPLPSTFFVMASTRLTYQIGIGLLSLNTRLTACANTAFTIVNMIKYTQLSGMCEAVQMPYDYVFLGYILQSVGCQAITVLTDRFLRGRLEAQMEASASASEINAVRRLLSVMCDADAQLGPGLQIEGSCHRLANLLMKDSTNAGSCLAGTNFTDLMADVDQQRFRDFVAHSVETIAVGNQNEVLRTPTTSLFVNLRDTAGIQFRVELFHVYIAELHGRHLIGICEEKERAMPDAVGELPNLGRMKGSKMRFEDESLLRAIHGKASPAPRACQKKGTSKSNTSSGSSADFSTATLMSQRDAISLLESVAISFRLEKDFPMNDCHFEFKSDLDPEQSFFAPKMMDWIASESRQRFMDWVMQSVNLGVAGQTASQTSHSVKLWMPGREDCLLKAAQVDISLGTADVQVRHDDETESDESAEIDNMSHTGDTEQSDDLVVNVTFRSFTVRKNHAPRRSDQRRASHSQH